MPTPTVAAEAASGAANKERANKKPIIEKVFLMRPLSHSTPPAQRSYAQLMNYRARVLRAALAYVYILGTRSMASRSSAVAHFHSSVGSSGTTASLSDVAKYT